MAHTFVGELDFPEAPVLLEDGGLAFVEMGPERGWVARVDARGGNKQVLATTGRPNGLARDRHGALWIAETAQRAVLRLAQDGTLTTVASGHGGTPFRFLNDLAFGPAGDLFVTDSGIEVEDVAPGGELSPAFRELDYDGCVYRVDPVSGDVSCIDHGLQFTNGLAFGPDGHLYVAETLTGNIWRYRCREGVVEGGRELFGNVIAAYSDDELQGPDGMKFSADGRLFACVFGQGDVTVLDPGGRVVERLATAGMLPTNLCFGAPGLGCLYVTEAESGVVQRLAVNADAHPLHG